MYILELSFSSLLAMLIILFKKFPTLYIAGIDADFFLHVYLLIHLFIIIIFCI